MKSYKKSKISNLVAIQVLIVFVILALISLIFFYFYSSFLKTNVTFIGGFNWTDGDIVVEIKGNVLNVGSGEMFSYQIQEKGEVLVSIIDSQDQIIRENSYNVGDKPSVIMELVSSKPEEECIVKADLSNFYYNISDDSQIQSEIVITDNPTLSYIYEFNNSVNINYLVYPGSYDEGFLPQEIEEGQTVEGFFFVGCENIDETSDLHADILGSIYYGQD